MSNFIRGVHIGHLLLSSSTLRARVRLAELTRYGVASLVGIHAAFVALMLGCMVLGAGAGAVVYLLSR